MPVENAMPISIADSFGVSILGFAIVFFVLVVLMFVIKILRGIVEQMNASVAPSAAPVAAPAAATPAPAANMVPAKGSLGEIKLYDVEDKTAAMIMAIVANELNAPLNELRFHSIREKK